MGRKKLRILLMVCSLGTSFISAQTVHRDLFQRRMRSAVKLRSWNLHPAALPSSRHQALRFSGQLEDPSATAVSESTSNAHRTQLEENTAENCSFTAISQVNRSKPFNVKPEILGEVTTSEETRSTNVVEKEYEKLSRCRSPVCENAQESSLLHTAPVVHQIVEIIFSKGNSAEVEERLGSSGLRFDSFIVERVLKRSFKKPHAARILFDWVKQKDGFHPTNEIYNTVLQIAGEAKDIEWMEELMDEMENASCEKNAKTWRIVISHFAESKLVDKALMCFEKMKRDGCEPDSNIYTKLICVFCSSGKPDVAMELFMETVEKKIILNVNIYKTLMTCLAKSGDAAAVPSIADAMIQLVRTRKHIAFGHMVNSLCSSGKLDEALETVRSIKNKMLPLVPQSYQNLVRGLSEVGRVEEAMEIVGMMKEKGVLDSSIYEIIIDGCLKRNDVSGALDLFGAMKDRNRVPSPSVYIKLIEKYFELNQCEKGWELFNEMLEKGTKLDQKMMMPVLLGFISRYEVSKGWTMLRTMKEKGIKPYDTLYSALVDELIKVGSSVEIINVLKEMQTSDVVIGDDLFGRVISYLEKNEDLENLETVKKLKNGDLEKLKPLAPRPLPNPVAPNCDKVLIRSTSRISRLLRASLNQSTLEASLKRCYENKKKFTPESVLLILGNCKLHGQAALTFFDWVGKIKGYSHTTETYEMAINIAGNCKSLMRMRGLFYEMRRNGVVITPNTWTILIMQCARNGVSGLAMEIFEEMKASGFEPTANIYKFLIISLCNKNNRRVDEAVRFFQEMIRFKHVPSKDLVATLLDCFCETNRLKDANKCVEDLAEAGYSSEQSYSLYIRAHKLKQALEIADKMELKGEKLDSYAYASLVCGFLRKGNSEAALVKIDDMKRVGITPTVHVYTPLMFHFFKKKQINRALEIFEKMKAEGCDPTVVTYSVMVQGFINCGKIDLAFRVFNQMKEKGVSPDFRTYETLISGLCSQSRSEEAVQLLNEMFHNGIPPSSEICRSVITGLDAVQKHDLAREIQQRQNVFERRRFGISTSGSYF